MIDFLKIHFHDLKLKIQIMFFEALFFNKCIKTIRYFKLVIQ